MNFGEAYSATEMGAGVKRTSWAIDPNMHVRLQRPDANSFMTEPYLYIATISHEGKPMRIPFQPAQGDLAADDWDYYDPGAAT